jgi:hypothetical protein
VDAGLIHTFYAVVPLEVHSVSCNAIFVCWPLVGRSQPPDSCLLAPWLLLSLLASNTDFSGIFSRRMIPKSKTAAILSPNDSASRGLAEQYNAA